MHGRNARHILAGSQLLAESRDESPTWSQIHLHMIVPLHRRVFDDERCDAGRLRGRRFLVHANYEALLHYNCAHHYTLAVGILAERIGDGL